MLIKNRLLSQRGFGLVMTLLFSSVVLVILALSVKFLILSLKESQNIFRKTGQALNVANAGAQQAVFWFTRQQVPFVNRYNMNQYFKSIDSSPTTDRVTYSDGAFWPRQNLTDPSASETDDESIGLVKDILIDGSNNLYGRYEVKRQTTANESDITPPVFNTATNEDDYNTNFIPSANIFDAVHDISHLKSNYKARSKGEIWRITSKGFLYRRNDTTKDVNGVFSVKYNQSPNILLSEAKVTLEIQRISIPSKVNGALLIADPSKLSVSSSTKNKVDSGPSSGGITGKSVIYGKTPGYAFHANVKSTATSLYDASLVSGLTCKSIFGVDEATLRGLSDQSRESVDQLTYQNGKLPRMSILFVNGNANFTASKPLTGGGILYVKGNLNIANNSNSFYGGIIFVTGNVTIGNGSSLSGSVIVGGATSTVTLNATSDDAEIIFSKTIVDTVKQKLANYRVNNLTTKFFDTREYNL